MYENRSISAIIIGVVSLILIGAAGFYLARNPRSAGGKTPARGSDPYSSYYRDAGQIADALSAPNPTPAPAAPGNAATNSTAPTQQAIPGQPVPGQPNPAQPPATGQAAPAPQVSGQPASGQPMPGQAATTQPATGQPMPGQPATTQPVPAQSAPGLVPTALPPDMPPPTMLRR